MKNTKDLTGRDFDKLTDAQKEAIFQECERIGRIVAGHRAQQQGDVRHRARHRSHRDER